MKFRKIVTFNLFLFSPFLMAQDPEIYRYKMQKGDTLTQVLWTIGVDDIYLDGKIRDKWLLLFPNISDPKQITTGTEIEIPAKYIKFTNNISHIGNDEIEFKNKLSTFEDRDRFLEQREQTTSEAPAEPIIVEEDKPEVVPAIKPEKKSEEPPEVLTYKRSYALRAFGFQEELKEKTEFSDAKTKQENQGSYEFMALWRGYNEDEILRKTFYGKAKIRTFIETEESFPVSTSIEFGYLHHLYSFSSVTPLIGFYRDEFSNISFVNPSPNVSTVHHYGPMIGLQLNTHNWLANLKLKYAFKLNTDSLDEELSGAGYEISQDAFYRVYGNWSSGYRVTSKGLKKDDYSISGESIYLGGQYFWD